MRLAAAALVLGAALAGAAVLHGHKALHVYDCPNRLGSCLYEVRLETPGWVNPVALGICLFGLAAAAAVLVRPLRRFIVAALILAAAVGGAVALSGYRVLGAEHSCPGTAGNACFYHPRPGWVVPAIAGIIVLGLAGAAGVLVTTRRSNPE